MVVQSNKPACGGPREGGNRTGAVEASLASRWVRIFLITAGSSIQAMIRSAPPQAGQVSMSMPKTRLSRCAQVIAARRSIGVFSSPSHHNTQCQQQMHETPWPGEATEMFAAILLRKLVGFNMRTILAFLAIFVLPIEP